MMYSVQTFDRVSSCRDFKIRWLSPGAFVSTLETFLFDRVHLYRGSASQRALFSGLTPPGFFTIICPDSAQSSIQFFGERLDAGRFGIGGVDAEPRILSREACGFMLCLTPVAVLENLLPETRHVWSWRSSQHLVLEYSQGMNFIRTLNDIMDHCRVPTDPPIGEGECRRVENEVLARVAELLTHGRPHSVSRSRTNRQQVLERALDTVHRQTGPMSLQELAAATGASPRTLQRIFRETLQYSPQKYLRWCRLCGFRRDLLAKTRGATTVTEIAAWWGFTEMGRVAGEYRQLFGESPRDTLRRIEDRSGGEDSCAA